MSEDVKALIEIIKEGERVTNGAKDAKMKLEKVYKRDVELLDMMIILGDDALKDLKERYKVLTGSEYGVLPQAAHEDVSGDIPKVVDSNILPFTDKKNLH
jgi:hypothetical protein